MKIPEQLPQFTQEIALLVVAGTYVADFYRACDGEIVPVGNFSVAKTDPDNDQGFVVAESGGEKKLKQARNAEFLKEFARHLHAALAAGNVNKVYVFAPGEVKNDLLEMIPAALQKNAAVFEGNFHNQHLTELLGKIRG